ncbi:MAG: sensor histidine kinase [Treponema sp.]|nr:sensor histidine kinase [Treponema sp.]
MPKPRLFLFLIFPLLLTPSCGGNFVAKGAGENTRLMQRSFQHRNTQKIQNIADKWSGIEQLFADVAETPAGAANTAALAAASDDFYFSFMQYLESDLYRSYHAIPFPPYPQRRITLHRLADNEEAHLAQDMARRFRDAAAAGDYESARLVQTEITRALIRLLIADGEAQRYIGVSYFRLMVTLIGFIICIAIFIWFLQQSLNRSLQREAEGAVFSHAYMLAQDEERARISRELHDTVIQDMRAVLLETEKLGASDDKDEREKLSAQTVPLMSLLIKKTRDICTNLIPPDFRFSELSDALRQLCYDFGKKTGIDCRAEINLEQPRIKLDLLPVEKRLQIFRIVQEALANIEKHAGAKEAILTMRYTEEKEMVFVSIGDDGKGFRLQPDRGHIKRAVDTHHIGITSMKERAVILGGNLTVVSEIGEGTLICLEFPLKTRM